MKFREIINGYDWKIGDPAWRGINTDDIARAAVLKTLHKPGYIDYSPEKMDEDPLVKKTCQAVGITMRELENIGLQFSASLAVGYGWGSPAWREISSEYLEQVKEELLANPKMHTSLEKARNTAWRMQENLEWIGPRVKTSGGILGIALITGAIVDSYLDAGRFTFWSVMAGIAAALGPFFLRGFFQAGQSFALSNLEDATTPAIVSRWVEAAKECDFRKIVISTNMAGIKDFEVTVDNVREAQNRIDFITHHMQQNPAIELGIAAYPDSPDLGTTAIYLSVTTKELTPPDYDQRRKKPERSKDRDWSWVPKPVHAR